MSVDINDLLSLIVTRMWRALANDVGDVPITYGLG